MTRLILLAGALTLAAAPATAQSTTTAPLANDSAALRADTSHVYYMREVDEPPALSNGEQIGRRIARVYPAALREAGTAGTVMLRFVLDPRGRVVPGTVEVVSSTDPAFEQPARDITREMIFSPAKLNGHAVRVEVTLPLQFALRR
jgi:TonB family protein